MASCRSLYTLTASLTARGMVSFLSVLPHLQPDIPDILVKQVQQHAIGPASQRKALDNPCSTPALRRHLFKEPHPFPGLVVLSLPTPRLKSCVPRVLWCAVQLAARESAWRHVKTEGFLGGIAKGGMRGGLNDDDSGVSQSGYGGDSENIRGGGIRSQMLWYPLGSVEVSRGGKVKAERRWELGHDLAWTTPQSRMTGSHSCCKCEG